MKTEKMKVKLFIHAEQRYGMNEFDINVSTYDLSGMDHMVAIPLSQTEVEVEVPVLTKEFTTVKHIEILKRKYEKEKRESHLRLENINNQINDLLCLDSK